MRNVGCRQDCLAGGSWCGIAVGRLCDVKDEVPGDYGRMRLVSAFNTLPNFVLRNSVASQGKT
jgi:hypothetical protein